MQTSKYLDHFKRLVYGPKVVHISSVTANTAWRHSKGCILPKVEPNRTEVLSLSQCYIYQCADMMNRLLVEYGTFLCASRGLWFRCVLQDGIGRLRRTCSAAAAFSMLLRLKRYLKIAYGLTLAKCQSYRPNDSTKVRLAFFFRGRERSTLDGFALTWCVAVIMLGDILLFSITAKFSDIPPGFERFSTAIYLENGDLTWSNQQPPTG